MQLVRGTWRCEWCNVTIERMFGVPPIASIEGQAAQQRYHVIRRDGAALHECEWAVTRPATTLPGTLAAALVSDDRAEIPSTRRRLYRVADDEVFAYAMRGYQFFRARNHERWADERDGLLVSARSGRPFARGIGNVFHDIDTNVALYYEHTPTVPASDICDASTLGDPRDDHTEQAMKSVRRRTRAEQRESAA